MKVFLIVSVFGACRREELMKLKIGDEVTLIMIKIPNTKTKIHREFAITRGNIASFDCLNNVRNCVRLRPQNIVHDRFLILYRNGKCFLQPIFSTNWYQYFWRIPKEIATFLELVLICTF